MWHLAMILAMKIAPEMTDGVGTFTLRAGDAPIPGVIGVMKMMTVL